MAEPAVIEKVDFLPNDEDEDSQPLEHPVLVSFPRNTAPPELKKAQPVLMNANEDTESVTGDKQLVCRTDEMEWRGKECGAQVPLDYFVAVYNKAQNTINLIETSAQFYMRPKLPADTSALNKDDDDNNAEEPKTGTQQRDDLLKMFGARKSKRRMAAFHRDQSQIIRPEMAASVADAAGELLKKNTNMEMQDEEGDLTSRPLAPPHSIDAKTPAEAYPLEHLMSPLEFEETKAKAETTIEQLLSLKNPENPGWHPLTFTYLLKIVQSQELNAESRLNRVVACYYLNQLIAFYNGTRKISRLSVSKLQRKLDISGDHVRCMLDRFTTKKLGDDNSRLRTAEMDDRVIYYAVVVWMIIEGFHHCGNIGELAYAFKLTPKELAIFALRVGAKTQRSKKTDVKDYSNFKYKLTVPLTFPVINRAKLKKRKRKSMR